MLSWISIIVIIILYLILKLYKYIYFTITLFVFSTKQKEGDKARKLHNYITPCIHICIPGKQYTRGMSNSNTTYILVLGNNK